MSASYNTHARKRAVNLTLNEDLVVQTRGLTDNLSGVVESLLADFLTQAIQRRAADAKTLKATVTTWNNFAAKKGFFADEHSTL